MILILTITAAILIGIISLYDAIKNAKMINHDTWDEKGWMAFLENEKCWNYEYEDEDQMREEYEDMMNEEDHYNYINCIYEDDELS